MNAADRDLVRAYQLTFGSEGARPVMDDLRRLAGRSVVRKDRTGRIDSHAMAVAEGMRILFNYIEAMTRVDQSPAWRAADLKRQMEGTSNG